MQHYVHMLKRLVNFLGFGNTRTLVLKLQEASPSEYYKANVDDIIQPITYNSSFGGLIRDENGHYCTGYYGNLGFEHVLFAEVWVLLHSVSMARNMSFKKQSL